MLRGRFPGAYGICRRLCKGVEYEFLVGSQEDFTRKVIGRITSATVHSKYSVSYGVDSKEGFGYLWDLPKWSHSARIFGVKEVIK